MLIPQLIVLDATHSFILLVQPATLAIPHAMTVLTLLLIALTVNLDIIFLDQHALLAILHALLAIVIQIVRHANQGITSNKTNYKWRATILSLLDIIWEQLIG